MIACDPARRMLVTISWATLLAGCGATQTPLGAPAVSGQSSLLDARGKSATRYDGKVFVSDLVNDTVWICPANFGDIRNGFTFPTAQLTGVSDPVQIAVDAQGTVYVANAQTGGTGAGSVTIYARGQTAPTRTLSAGLDTSMGIAVDSAGTVYVSNKLLASIEVFPKGKNTPSATITANLTGPDGLAVNRAGDLFIADSSADNVLELAHGTKTPKPLGLSGIERPTGIAVDSHGNLYVANLAGAASRIAVFAPSSTKPSRVFSIRGPGGLIDEPLMISMTPGDLLIVSSFSTLHEAHGIWEEDGAVAAGFAYGQSTPSWLEYNQSFNYGEFVVYDDAVFAPAR
jgi:hypothetical protein